MSKESLALASAAILHGVDVDELKGEFVRIGLTGDGRPAVLEKGNDGEPLQYLASTSSPKKLVGQWDDAFRVARLKINRHW